MQRIITTEFGYCCEKVFSFANAPTNEPFVRLAVRANKWGGCCVDWWYHVAPLIRVRFTLVRIRAVMALVIDPSMFDMPVPLSTWLAAQEDKSCHPNAKVRMDSIQPGSAYGPANWQGTMFVTDPPYTMTNLALPVGSAAVLPPHHREMTVANVREPEGADYAEVAFLESARFYRLPRQNPIYDEALRLLRDAMEKGGVLKIGLTSLDSDIIDEVQEP